MKRQGSTLMLNEVFAAAALFAAPPIPAQQSSNAQMGTSGGSLVSSQSLSNKYQKRFVYLTKRYKLIDGQQEQVRSILWKEQQDAQTVNADTLMSNRNKRDELADLHEASQQKIGSILSKQQKRKFDADEKVRAQIEGRSPWPNLGPPLNF